MEFAGGKRALSEKTVALYTHNLQKLNNGNTVENTKFLKPFKKIMETIQSKPKTTGRSYLIAIVSYLKGKDEKLYAKYYDEMMKMNNELKSNTTKSDKQEANWISQDEILKLQDDMMAYLPKKSKKTITSMEYEKLLDLVVLSLYTLQPPRRCIDYVEMRVGPAMDTDNWFDGSHFTFNNYKTAGTYKQQIETVSPKLKEILTIYLKHKPTESNSLLVSKNKAFKNSNEITRRLNRIFGKKISVSMLRNIYLTEKYGNENVEKQKDAAAMGTSVNTIDNNYVKLE
jgi:integrase